MITRKNRLNFFILIFSIVAIVFCYVFVFFRNIKFNMTEHFVNLDELNEESEIQFSIYERGGESDYWISGLSEEARYETGLDSLKGITFDAVIENNTSYVITDWSLRLVANTRVYIERAWCGKVEIFQSFENSYLSQNLDLRNFDDSDIRVKAILLFTIQIFRKRNTLSLKCFQGAGNLLLKSVLFSIATRLRKLWNCPMEQFSTA